ncbi:MAG TPA: nuclear transport factor 2 family protein [Xanthomonadales bacterium]|nr:nuclear transport factor 2 family protein [Xanthomonadales bacterium]
MSDRESRISEFLDKAEIQDVLMRYGRGVDRADEDLLKSCYHADAIEEHGSTYSGPAHGYIEAAVGRIQKMGTMAHYICNVFIDIEDDLAYVETYVLTFARFHKGEEDEDWDTFTGGRIVDRFEKRGGQWKIAHRKMAFDWNHDIRSSEGWALGLFNPDDPRMMLGRKDREDLSYQRF